MVIQAGFDEEMIRCAIGKVLKRELRDQYQAAKAEAQ